MNPETPSAPEKRARTPLPVQPEAQQMPVEPQGDATFAIPQNPAPSKFPPNKVPKTVDLVESMLNCLTPDQITALLPKPNPSNITTSPPVTTFAPMTNASLMTVCPAVTTPSVVAPKTKALISPKKPKAIRGIPNIPARANASSPYPRPSPLAHPNPPATPQQLPNINQQQHAIAMAYIHRQKLEEIGRQQKTSPVNVHQALEGKNQQLFAQETARARGNARRRPTSSSASPLMFKPSRSKLAKTAPAPPATASRPRADTPTPMSTSVPSGHPAPTPAPPPAPFSNFFAPQAQYPAQYPAQSGIAQTTPGTAPATIQPNPLLLPQALASLQHLLCSVPMSSAFTTAFPHPPSSFFQQDMSAPMFNQPPVTAAQQFAHPVSIPMTSQPAQVHASLYGQTTSENVQLMAAHIQLQNQQNQINALQQTLERITYRPAAAPNAAPVVAAVPTQRPEEAINQLSMQRAMSQSFGPLPDTITVPFSTTPLVAPQQSSRISKVEMDLKGLTKSQKEDLLLSLHFEQHRREEQARVQAEQVAREAERGRQQRNESVIARNEFNMRSAHFNRNVANTAGNTNTFPLATVSNAHLSVNAVVGQNVNTNDAQREEREVSEEVNVVDLDTDDNHHPDNQE